MALALLFRVKTSQYLRGEFMKGRTLFTLLPAAVILGHALV